VLRTLLAGAIDYAGLFPPAGLDMATTARNYADYRAGADAWALGRLVVPAERLAELEREAAELLAARRGGPWRVSALLAGDLEDDTKRVEAFNRRQQGAAVVDAVEARAAAPWEVEVAREALPRGASLFIELPLEDDPHALLTAVRDAGAMAKVRTGGVTPDAFPSPAMLARFLRACASLAVPFKATAGLHHPLCAEYPLTYAGDSDRGTMYGFLNLLLAAVVARAGGDEPELIALLEERSPSTFRIDAEAVQWRGRRLDERAIAEARRDLVRSFGSCSFREPLDSLAMILSNDGSR
jgi:hypothetical protein